MTIIVNGSGLEGIGMNNTKYAQYGGLEQVKAFQNGEPDPDTKIQFVPNVNNIAPRPGHWSEKKKEYALKKAKGEVVQHGPWGGAYNHAERH